MVNTREKKRKEEKKLARAASSALSNSGSKAKQKPKPKDVDNVPMPNPAASRPQPRPAYKGTKSIVGKDTVNPHAGTEDAVAALLSLNGHEIQVGEHISAWGSGGSDEDSARKKRKWDGEEDAEESGEEIDDAGDEDEKDSSLDMSDDDEGEKIITYHTYDVANVITPGQK